MASNTLDTTRNMGGSQKSDVLKMNDERMATDISFVHRTPHSTIRPMASVTGPQCGTMGYVVRDPRSGRRLQRALHKTDIKKDKVLKGDKHVEKNKARETYVQAIQSIADKSNMNRLKHDFDLGMQEADRELDLKRNRLKALLLSELVNFTREYVDQAQRVEVSKFESDRKLVEDIKRAREARRQNLADEKRDQQFRENSLELRETLSKLSRMAIAQAQEDQIHEKEIIKHKQKEIDQLWAEVMHCDVENKKAAEILKEIERTQRIKKENDIREKQILGKRILNDELDFIKAEDSVYQNAVRMKLAEEAEQEKQKKEKDRMDYLKQMTEAIKQSTEKREIEAKREMAIDNSFKKLIQKELKMSMENAIDTRVCERAEAEYYFQYLKDLKTDKVRVEKYAEDLRAQEVERVETIHRATRQQSAALREKLKQEVKETRRMQLLEKEKKMKQEAKLRSDEVECSRNQYALQNQLFIQQKNAMQMEEKKNKEDLLSQAEYIAACKEKEKRAGSIAYQQQQELEKMIAAKIKRILEKPDPQMQHPFFNSFEK